MKEYVIGKLIDKLEEVKGWDNYKTYLCDLNYDLWESENADGSITYDTSEAKEWIKENFDDIGDVYEELIEQGIIDNLNPFEEPEKFMVVIVMGASDYLLGQCPTVEKYWNDEKTLTDNFLNKIIKELEKVDLTTGIYEQERGIRK